MEGLGQGVGVGGFIPQNKAILYPSARLPVSLARALARTLASNGILSREGTFSQPHHGPGFSQMPTEYAYFVEGQLVEIVCVVLVVGCGRHRSGGPTPDQDVNKIMIFMRTA